MLEPVAQCGAHSASFWGALPSVQALQRVLRGEWGPRQACPAPAVCGVGGGGRGEEALDSPSRLHGFLAASSTYHLEDGKKWFVE